MLQATVGTLLAHDVRFAAFLLTLKRCAQSRAALQLEVLALRHPRQVAVWHGRALYTVSKTTVSGSVPPSRAK
jgi:hypothetical protein